MQRSQYQRLSLINFFFSRRSKNTSNFARFFNFTSHAWGGSGVLCWSGNKHCTSTCASTRQIAENARSGKRTCRSPDRPCASSRASGRAERRNYRRRWCPAQPGNEFNAILEAQSLLLPPNSFHGVVLVRTKVEPPAKFTQVKTMGTPGGYFFSMHTSSEARNSKLDSKKSSVRSAC